MTNSARQILAAFDPQSPARHYAACLELAEDDSQIIDALTQIDHCHIDRMVVAVQGSDRVAALAGVSVEIASRLRDANPTVVRSGHLICQNDLNLRGIGPCEIRCLVEVKGTLKIKWGQGLQFPSLRRIGGSVAAQGTGYIHLPRLEDIKGNLWLDRSLNFHAPVLRRVRGDLTAIEARKATLIALQEVGDLNAEGARDLKLPLRLTV